MRFPEKYAIDHLSSVLGLPPNGQVQGWDIQVADEARLEEFIARFAEFSSDEELAYAMRALIVASFDARLAVRIESSDLDFEALAGAGNLSVSQVYTATEQQLWLQVANLLKTAPNLFDPIIRYWSFEADNQSFFPCTLLLRNEFRNLGAP